MNGLQLMAQEENSDVIAITEHWKSKDELPVYKIIGYKLVSSFCRSRGRHGGCAIYIREELKFTERSDYNLISIPNVIECSSAQIHSNNHKILIICVYRPNSQPLADVDLFLEKLKTLLEKCTLERAPFILVGDFNLDILSGSHDSVGFISLLESFNLEPLIRQPTRPSSGTCLDNVITPLVGQAKVIEHHICDHSALKFTSNLNFTTDRRIKSVKRRIINDESTDIFLQELSLLSWDDIFVNSSDPNHLWNIFHSRFFQTFDRCFPKVTIHPSTSRNNFKLTPELINMKKHLDLLYILSFSRSELKDTYKSVKKHYDSLLSRARRDHFSYFIRNSENKSKASWKVINSLTKTCQHGFVRNRSIETATYELINEVLVSLESGEVPMGLFLDLTKAFDCVEHERLLEILDDCGIRDNQLKLIDSYLTSRKQIVVMEVDGELVKSDIRENKMGVPQGSIPGPILFIIYINKLPKAKVSAKYSMRMFADDTNYLLKSSDIVSAVVDSNNVLKSVGDWFQDHNLILNIDKTQCIFFYTEKSKLNYPSSVNIANSNVVVKHSVVFLGLVLDRHLKWGPHTEQLRCRLNSICYMLFMLRDQIDFDLMKIIYYSNFQSIMSYGIIFWGNSSHVGNLFIVQKRALRTMLNLGFRESCRGLFKSNNILTIYGLYIYRLLIFFRNHSRYFELLSF
ncbi:uncharacterized protein LOC123322291 [Coccinella septempunctata]|uniref:uncharacterized protein LOC123322291 n=1 Tax=Coccinella septempunctata TaxID=41139 RepID=UPI001D07166B|nr:uncharacterized protein LOC123322291 [Coccinella septempunctata]